MNATLRDPDPGWTRPMMTAARTLVSAAKYQWIQPLPLSSAYTFPLWLPTNTRPPTTVGCASAARSPGKPKAHLSFRRGTWAAVNPAAAPSCSRVLNVLTPQPFHSGPVSGPAKSPESAAHIDCGDGLVNRGRPKDFPVTNSATARRSTAVRPAVIEIMTPLSSAARTRSGDIARSASRPGARSKPVSWHVAQIRP